MNAAQTLSGFQQLVGLLAGMNWLQLFKLAVAGLVTIYNGPTLVQHLSELIITYLDVPLFFKPFVPKIVSGAIGGLLNWAGVDPVTATAAATYLTTQAEKVNASPLALDLENKIAGIPTLLSKINLKSGASALLFLIGLGLALSNNAGLGSSVYTIQDDGSWLPTGGTLISDNLNFSFGSLSGTSFSEYVGISLGAGFESRNGEQFGDGLIGITLPVPSTDGDIFIGPAWRMFTGDKYPGIAIAANFQLGQPLKIWP
jgi:hypothetical protein